MRQTYKAQQGLKIDLAQRSDHFEKIAVSFPLWDKWGTSKASTFFRERMRPDMFSVPEYREVCEILLEMLPTYEGLTIQTVMMAYKTRTGKEITYAHFTASMEATEGQYACFMVCTLWQRREMSILGTTTAASASDSGMDIYDITLMAQKRIMEIERAGTFRHTEITQVADRVLENIAKWEAGEATSYTSSGFTGLDRAVGGFPLGEIVSLAGMTGAGKTALLCNMALLKGKKSEKVLVFSAEMSSENLLERLAAIDSGQNVQALRFRRGVAASDYQRYAESVRRVRTLPLFIDDHASPTLVQIEARILEVQPELVFVDYLEKVDVGPERSEELRVSQIAQGLKAVAKKTGTCIVVLSQYSRDKDAHKSVPKDSWLRYSGKIEQESAMILHWWWPGYWIKNKGMEPIEVFGFDPADEEQGKLMVTKNRFGRSYTHALRFQPETMRFHEYTSQGYGY
jgi:replicative DNA helicase